MSYNDKHNEANKDENRDGENHNRSWNCGVEGPTDDPEIRALRAAPDAQPARDAAVCRRACRCCWRAMSSATRQQGNNNAYCQDNELTWLSWEHRRGREAAARVRARSDPPAAATIACSAAASSSRTARSAARTCATSSGSIPPARRCPTSSGATASRAASAVFLSGRGLDERDERGRTIVDTDFIVLVNAHYEAVEFKLPAQPEDARWALRVDTTNAQFEKEERVFAPGDTYAAAGASAGAVRGAVNIPRATYRLQFNREFTFADATRIVPYLARLGISHVYASPILKARPGSMHGYDVTDHTRLNPELGTQEEFEALVATLHEHGMGLIVDIVPNHLGVMGDDNAWWLDVLENGPAARAAHHFDIDWRPNRGSMRDRVLVPMLGDAYGAVLERGELQLQFDPAAGSFAMRYHEHLLPIDPREYPRIFAPTPIAASGARAGRCASRRFRKPAERVRAICRRAAIPPRTRSRSAIATRKRTSAVWCGCSSAARRSSSTSKRRSRASTARRAIRAASMRSMRCSKRRPIGLSYWRVAVDEINYRRFFDVNDLAALRMNEPACSTARTGSSSS